WEAGGVAGVPGPRAVRGRSDRVVAGTGSARSGAVSRVGRVAAGRRTHVRRRRAVRREFSALSEGAPPVFGDRRRRRGSGRGEDTGVGRRDRAIVRSRSAVGDGGAIGRVSGRGGAIRRGGERFGAAGRGSTGRSGRDRRRGPVLPAVAEQV